MVDEEFLQLLRCPLTHRSLAVAEPELVSRLNAAVDAGALVNRLGQTVDGPMEAALVDELRSWAYPIRNGIPCLLVDEALELEQLSDREGARR